MVEEALARTLTTNLVTTTLYVRPPTLRKQAPAYAVKLLKKMFSQETSEVVAAELLQSYQH